MCMSMRQTRGKRLPVACVLRSCEAITCVCWCCAAVLCTALAPPPFNRPSCPTMLNYAIAAENGSMYNTPPCWPIYICGLVFKHLLKLGGLAGTCNTGRGGGRVGREWGGGDREWGELEREGRDWGREGVGGGGREERSSAQVKHLAECCGCCEHMCGVAGDTHAACRRPCSAAVSAAVAPDP